MAAQITKLGLNLSTLAPGFHRRRFQTREIGFDAWIWRGSSGPVVLLNGATHGDEYEGPTLLRQWADQWRPTQLCGTIVMVPVLNEAAFYAATRCHPQDGGNLARAFPGNPRGKATARLAHLFDTQLMSQVTHYVDLHSGGSAYELLPWVGYSVRQDRIGKTQREMAACFDKFWCWAGPPLPGRTLSAAFTRDIPAIYVECRGAGGVAPIDLASLNRGLKNLLRWAGMTRGSPPTLRAQIARISDDSQEAHLQVHHPAPQNGLFVPSTKLGDQVRKGTVLGVIHALNHAKLVQIKAESNGRIVMMRYQRSVLKSDALFTLAPI